jgi:hypothetical protein
MSNSTIKSNLVGKNGTEVVVNFATIGDSSTALVGASVSAGNYIKLGTHKYIISNNAATAADVLANATAIDASILSSIVLGLNKIWYIPGPATINFINATALS